MIARMDDLPAPERPISSTLRCFWRLPRSGVLMAIIEDRSVWRLKGSTCMFCLCCFARLSRPPASSTASKHRALPATPTPLCDGGVLALTTLFKASNLASDTTIVFSHRRLWLSVVSNIEFVALYTMARWHPSQLHALSLILRWQIPHFRAFHINNHHLPIRSREQQLHYCEFQGAASNMLSSPSKEAFSLLSQLEKAFDNPKLMLYTITLKSAMAPVRV